MTKSTCNSPFDLMSWLRFRHRHTISSISAITATLTSGLLSSRQILSAGWTTICTTVVGVVDVDELDDAILLVLESLSSSRIRARKALISGILSMSVDAASATATSSLARWSLSSCCWCCIFPVTGRRRSSRRSSLSILLSFDDLTMVNKKEARQLAGFVQSSSHLLQSLKLFL